MENIKGYNQTTKPTEKQEDASRAAACDLEEDLDLAQDLHSLALSSTSGHVVQPSAVGSSGKRQNQKNGKASSGTPTNQPSGILKLKPNVAATRLRTNTMKQYNNLLADCDKARRGHWVIIAIDQLIGFLSLCYGLATIGCSFVHVGLKWCVFVSRLNRNPEAVQEFQRAQVAMVKHIAKLHHPGLLNAHGEVTMDDNGHLPDNAKKMLDTDPRTMTMMSRSHILECFMDQEPVKTIADIENMQSMLFDEVQMDDYLKENICSPEVRSTIGRIRYIREFLFTLQTTSEKVVALNDAHRDMMNSLTVIAKALQVEVQQVQASANAEYKASVEEEKTKRLEEERLQKKMAQEQARAERKRQKEEQKRLAKQKAEAQKLEEKKRKLEDEANNPKEPEDNTTRQRSRRCKTTSDLTETDPMLLRDKLPKDVYLNPQVEFDKFIESICQCPHSLEVLRMKAVARKVIMSYPNMSKESGNGYMKKLLAVPCLFYSAFFSFFGRHTAKAKATKSIQA